MANNLSLDESSVFPQLQASLSSQMLPKAQPYRLQRQMYLLTQLHEEKQKMRLLLALFNINIKDIEQAVVYAIQTLFNLNSSQLTQSIKRVMRLASDIIEQNQLNNQAGLKKEPAENNGINQGLQFSRMSQVKGDKIGDQLCNESLQQQLRSIKISQAQQDLKISSSQNGRNVIPALNNKQYLSDKKASSIFSTQASDKEVKFMASNYRNQKPAQQIQQRGIIEEGVSFKQQTGMCYPIVWETNHFFNIHNKSITKQINDDYKKICSQLPLKEGTHSLKFRMIKMGTVAFGIVLEQFKNGTFIDDRRFPAVKYLSFSNGKGMIKYEGNQVMKSSSDLHLQMGSTLQIIYDSHENFISFYNRRMMRPFKINLRQNFRNKRIHFFIEMKGFQTKIQQF